MTWLSKHRADWQGWIVHVVLGGVIPILAGRRGGYSACAWATIGGVFTWAAWELATPLLAPVFGWGHAYADLSGFITGAAGVLAGASAWLLMRSDREAP